MKTVHLMFFVFAVTFSLVASGCKSGGSSGGSGASGEATPTECEDVAGEWLIEEESSSAICGDEFDSYTLTAAQDGCSLSVSTNVGVFDGSIDGRTITWSGSYPEDGGTVVITSLTVTVSEDGQSLEGSSTWSWSDGVESCTGSTQIFGVKL